MLQFKSGWSFIHFSESVRYRYRYAHTADVDDFLSALKKTSKTRTKLIPAGSIFWRAQLGTATAERQIEDSDLTVSYEEDIPLPADRMVPLRGAAHEGRVNSKGIPCLYLATDKETAMSEVRPWLGAKISIATFKTIRESHIVDCSLHHSAPLNPDLLLGSPSSEEITDGIWAQIDRAFSEPINDDLKTAGYAPTQVIAETFRQNGHDGVVYKSRLGPGFNLALFDPECAELSKRMLFSATAVAYEFKNENP